MAGPAWPGRGCGRVAAHRLRVVLLAELARQLAARICGVCDCGGAGTRAWACLGNIPQVQAHRLSGARALTSELSLGSTRRAIFRHILLPGALPFVFTGFAVAIGITWEVVIAAEMASATNGLGYLTWNAYVNHSLPGIIIGMLSIGFAGMASSAIVIWLGRRAMPWQNRI